MTTSSGRSAGAPSHGLRLPESAGTALAAMVGAGLFVVWAPAARAAGDQLLLAVLLAALVTVLNVVSSVRLARTDRNPVGAHVHVRDRLGIAWGHLAGWAFTSGAVSAAAALALTIGLHLFPASPKVVGVVVTLVVLGLVLQGIHHSPGTERVVALLTVLVVFVFVDVLLATPPVLADPPVDPEGAGGLVGVVQAGGFVVFALAGHLRVVNLRQSMADPRSTLPRALAVALGAVIALLLFVTVALEHTLGVGWLAAREAPLAEAAEISAWPWLGPVLRVAAVLAAGGVLLGLTTMTADSVATMARDRHLPVTLAAREGSRRVPRRAASVVVAFAVVSIVLVDVEQAMAFASFCLLVHFALLHASAWTLERGWSHRLVPALGVVGCLGVALLMPWPAVLAGIIVLLVGATVGWVRHTTRE